MKKCNFVGGKLKLKHSKIDKNLIEIKKVITKDTKHLKNLDHEPEKEMNNDNIIAGLDENEEKYMNSLVDFINNDTRTAAEKLFDERRMKRLPEKIKKNINTTYKNRYESFTKSLSKLPEHYDIPKVGPG
jgi:protein FAM32A